MTLITIEDPMVALEQEFLAADAATYRLDAAGAPDAWQEVAYKKWIILQRQFVTTPATTAGGIAAKLRWILSTTNDEYFDQELLESILQDLERLAGEARS